ncbi:hypothetical protein Poli38472_001353 [Pythium oligandrum]|uniref:HNH nuclease domain-containing protein n=1 Tax=Pythium oligandrum TaxID=41045 RepID=A0A8K1FRN9_PYTOL|nr:hypothetical protein Poli38472_001353 [Pythium oligandrum]|eukprot:TMW69197.1 hypothetical protein Poli38472_001353 [Pythium oligandrum]
MYSIVCGQDVVFSVEVDADMVVWHLTTRIDSMLEERGFDPYQYELYIAKWKDRWLTTSEIHDFDSIHELRLLKGRLIALAGLGLSREDVQQEEVDATTPAQAPVHVLLSKPNPKPWRWTDDSPPTACFTASVREAYKCDEPRRIVRCMVLDAALPANFVVALHLYKPLEPRFAPDFEDIDDMRNGLVVCKRLAQAYVALQICFLYDAQSDQFRLKVLDQTLANERIVSRLAEQERVELHDGREVPNMKKRGKAQWFLPHTKFDIRTTFGDLDARSLCFRSLLRPFKRCLYLQARLARWRAIESHWHGAKEVRIDDFRDEGMSLAPKMEFFNARSGR